MDHFGGVLGSSLCTCTDDGSQSELLPYGVREAGEALLSLSRCGCSREGIVALCRRHAPKVVSAIGHPVL